MSSFSLKLKNGLTKEFCKPCVMGVINISPDSFHNPSKSISEALFIAEKMVQQGAEILDIGGVATNPFVDANISTPSIAQEIDRVVPLIESITKHFETLISVDTSNPEVMYAAVNAGAGFINDQKMLQVPGAVETVLKLQVPICLMHLFIPKRLPASCKPDELLEKIKMDLKDKITALKNLGIDDKRIVIDPGFGQGYYGKNKEENFYLLAQLNEFIALNYPVLIGWSRKSMIGDALGGLPPTQRLFGSIAAASIGGFLGASIIRTHDVEETVQAMKIVKEIIKFI